MSSNRQARLRPPRTWSLRIRLLLTLVALLAFVCAGIGIGTELALHRFLLTQLDEQLVNSAHRSAAFFDIGPPPPPPGRFPMHGMPPPPGMRPPPPPMRPFPPAYDPTTGPGPAFLAAPGQATRTVGALVTGHHVVAAGIINRDGSREAVNDAAATRLATIAPHRRPTTVELPGLGSYRVVAARTRSGPTVVTGLPTSEMDDTLFTVGVIFGIVAGVALLTATALGIVVIRRQLAPLSRVAAAARDVADLELDRGEVRLPTPIANVDPRAAHTEVGQLGMALNRMLDRIAGALTARHASETRIRQFVADASHELRTPLAAISGYTELVARRRDELPPEVAHAMSRVESESARMTQLVEDMLLLARLDEGRPLERAEVDLSALAVDAVSDAHIAGPDHRWELELPDEPVTTVGDHARLQQVLGNLLANSRTHTPAGTTVITSLVVADDGSVAMSVVDDGPGIPTGQQDEIFERFVRGDSSRSRRDGSTGLGLSIVSAVVKAHHGTIDVRSEPGRTEFTVRLAGSQPVHSAVRPGA